MLQLEKQLFQNPIKYDLLYSQYMSIYSWVKL